MNYYNLIDQTEATHAWSAWACVQAPTATLAQRLVALRQLLLTCTAVGGVYYLEFEADQGRYVPADHEPSLPALAGRCGDDRAVQAQLAERPLLALSALAPSCLGSRLGAVQGWLLAVSLAPGTSSVVLLLADEEQTALWAQWVRGWLQQSLSVPAPAPLLPTDPQPTLLADAQARVLDSNPALRAAQTACPLDALLPANFAALVHASLEQNRVIEAVPGPALEQRWHWSFIPDPGRQWVLVRGRDATEFERQMQQAIRAQRLYRVITENTTDLISRHTPAGVFLDATPASWMLLGYWPEALRGRSVHRMMHPQDARQHLQAAHAELETNGYHTMTYRGRHHDGRYVWLETASRAIRDTYTGSVVEVVSVTRDITVRVEVQENRRRLAQVVQATTDLVLFVEADGRVSSCNHSAERALGLDASQALPTLAQLMAQDDWQRLQDLGWAQADTSGVWSTEARMCSAEGRELPVSLVLLAHQREGQGRYYSLVARDMTERELREAEQRRHQDELAHVARLVTLGELASGIAHEINQPLAAVVNYAGASLRYLQQAEVSGAWADKVAQGLERITAHAQHASQVIARLRAFLRKGQRRLQPVSLLEVARDAVRLCQWEATAAKVQVIDALAPLSGPVYADPVLLEQVLINVLRNAIEANSEQHPNTQSCIELRCAEMDGYGLIEVLDQGPGVSEQALAQLFTPFYTSKANGLGLGLSMSRSLIEGFGGTLEARPREGGGLSLECRLPLARRDGNKGGDVC